MEKFYFIIKVFTIFLIFSLNANSKEVDFFKKGKEFFEKNDFQKSKILFERDIVFNPKSERSYLYLSKIFNKDNNDQEEEINLNTVLILNPTNDEAIYLLALLKIKQSDYNEAKKLIEKFDLVCQSFCFKKNEMQKKFKKLTPNDEQN
tara:strand:+ start:145 stop:588 length:444 start_codon:yes stop_codon:yes gene_type:complete